MTRNSRGFTLIEIMVVVIIIGLLATLILPKVLGRQEEAFVAKARSDIRALSSALKLYKLDHFRYPDTSQGLEVLVGGGEGGKTYIDRLPGDPWANDYQYLFPGEQMEFDVWSWGANGSGQLGNQQMFVDSNVPVRVAFPDGTRIVTVAAGGFHSLALESRSFFDDLEPVVDVEPTAQARLLPPGTR